MDVEGKCGRLGGQVILASDWLMLIIILASGWLMLIILTSDWLTEYHLDNLLYTLYTADQGAFAVDHR